MTKPIQTKSAGRCHIILQRLLSAGPQPASSIRPALQVAGYAWRSAQDAAAKLGVIRTKGGMQVGWTWSLPAPVPEGAEKVSAFGEGGSAPVAEPSIPCLAAYGYLVPDDGLVHGLPERS